MEELGYVNIFATKGIEYLLVIGYLMLLVVFWKFLNRPAAAAGEESKGVTAAVGGWFNLAQGVFYHQGHGWARPGKGGVVKVGMDDFAQKLLGSPNSLELPEVGTRVEQGGRAWKVNVDSKAVNMLSPVEGVVVAVNEQAVGSPESVCRDPYGEGWLIKVKVPKLKSNLKNLFSGRLADAWMEETVENLRGRLSGDLGIVLQDGGMPVSGFVRNLSPDNWEEIAREFLLSE
ncbi:glycine cleavage system protein H [Gemmatimonadota bacterium]